MFRIIHLWIGVIVIASVSAAEDPAAQTVDLKITAVPKIEKDKASLNRNTATTVSKGFYKVTLKNLSMMDAVPELRVNYRLFLRRDDGKKNPRDLPMIKENGEATVTGIPRSGLFTFDTRSVTLHSHSIEPGYYYTSGARGASKDELVGIWIKVFHGSMEIAEYALPGSLTKDQKF